MEPQENPPTAPISAPESTESSSFPSSPRLLHIKLFVEEDDFVMYAMPPPSFKFKGRKDDENTIRKEEAICRVCFDVFSESKVIKTKCKCKFTLLHQKCSTQFFQEKGKKCNVCEEEILPVPVTLCGNCLRSMEITTKLDSEGEGAQETKIEKVKKVFQSCLGHNNRPIDSKDGEDATIFYAL